jgi:hypothetical protein
VSPFPPEMKGGRPKKQKNYYDVPGFTAGLPWAGNMMNHFDLIKNIFNPVAAHLQTVAQSLHAIRRFQGGGIEGWFKVEVVAALEELVDKVRNKGPDLLLNNGNVIELKAGCGLDAAYIRKGASKYRAPCLFLGYGGNLALLNTEDVVLLAHTELSDGHDTWVVGLIRPRS